jgi:hypothetical protein
MSKPKPEIRKFDNFAAAFDYCRECDQPVIVRVGHTKYRLFPSGKSLKVK